MCCCVTLQQSADEGVEVVVTSESPWEPDDQAIVDPVNFRLNSWNNSCLGESRRVGSGGRVTNAVGTIFRKIFVGTRARPI